jgi:hypothetical protein
MPQTLRSRWTLFLLLAVTLVLAWLDLRNPDGVYAWTFIAVVMVCTLIALRGTGRRRSRRSWRGFRGAQRQDDSSHLLSRGVDPGLTGFGGGLAVLSQIEQRLVERRRLVPIRRFSRPRRSRKASREPPLPMRWR